uniref:Transmembrane and coiled-coil domain-containing protein 4 n=1 Tax=Globodera rostochiensis TaxID=31243 RepID=A0A914HMF9_GLORO
MAKTHSAALEMQSAQTKMPSASSDLPARSEMPKASVQMPLAQAETLAGQADARSAQEEMPPASVETHPDLSPPSVGVPSLLLPFTNNAATSSSTTTALSASLPRSMSEVFPRRHRRTASANDGQQPANQSPSEDGTASCLGSPCSSSSLPAHFASPATAILLKSDQISAIARFAFTDLVITVLRLDFYRPSDQEAIFCKCSLDILLKWGELPAKTQQSLRKRIEENQPFNEDIGALITAIKLDPLLRQPHGLLHLLGSLLLSVLINGDYDSRFRVLLRHISALLGIHWDLFEEFESTLGDRLIDEYKETVDNQRVRESKSRLKKLKRYAMIGAASGLGGVLIGVTGGLAAPVILTSISALTATTILLPAAASAAILGSVFGAAGAGLTGYRMQKRVGDIEEFHIERLTEQQNQGLHCVLCVSGWIEDREESAFRHHWRHLWMSKEQYTLRWESNYLEELGRSIDYFVSFVVSYAIQRSLMETMLASLVSAVAWPLVLLGSSCVIDNPWNICTRRARQVGEHLAEVLLTRQHGRRPITLIGFSLGARVLYHCLLEMSKRVPDSLGIVQDVILLGAPVSASPSQWRQLCSTDWLLRFLYRAMSVQFIIAGTGPVDSRTERKIVNFNLSHIVKGHLDYAKKMTQVLEAVGVRCTPLSHASRADLSNDDEAPQAVANAEEAIERAEIAQELDEQSTVVEHLKHGLGSVKHEVDHHEAEREKHRTKKRNFVVGSMEKGGEIISDDGEEPIDPLLGVRLRASNAKTAVAAPTNRSSADGAAESARRTNSADSTDTYLSAVSTT